MKIKSIKVIEGKNKWSETKDKLIHMVLDLGEYEQKPSNKIDGFYERIKEYLPSLKSHRCSEGKVGGFLKRIKEGTWMGHIIEHVALELQTLAGYDTGWGRTRSVRDQKGVYNVVFNYEDKECGKMAAREAYNVVKDIINDKDPQIDNIVKKLKPKKQIRESIRRILREETNEPKRINNNDTFQYLIDMEMERMKEICNEQDSENTTDMVSFDVCDFLEYAKPEVEVTGIDNHNDKPVIIVKIKVSARQWYKDEESFVDELERRLIKWIGNNIIEAEDINFK